MHLDARQQSSTKTGHPISPFEPRTGHLVSHRHFLRFADFPCRPSSANFGTIPQTGCSHRGAVDPCGDSPLVMVVSGADINTFHL
ncbi:hypothetical protein B0H67DRAFT_571407 [Lasiosphaeris hirsuta]|uniref:Uncharacterized protein n=1 Tax=Lasiosphaeris hirsuta TaxID=260670 RepID=A0AA40B143_9PEZI|nr:hypothetical protein B0H67DRAFT_571407 [Lasiosphaeris hirsuta]